MDNAGSNLPAICECRASEDHAIHAKHSHHNSEHGMDNAAGQTTPLLLADGRMTPRNAALYLGLAVKTLAIHRWKGTGPAYVKAGRVFYFRTDLDAWLHAARRTNTGHQHNAPVRSEAA